MQRSVAAVDQVGMSRRCHPLEFAFAVPLPYDSYSPLCGQQVLLRIEQVEDAICDFVPEFLDTMEIAVFLVLGPPAEA